VLCMWIFGRDFCTVLVPKYRSLVYFDGFDFWNSEFPSFSVVDALGSRLVG